MFHVKQSKARARIREKIECHRKAMKEYNVLINQDKKLMKMVDELDKLWWKWKLGK